MEIIGYFVDRDGDRTNPHNVFVAIAETRYNKFEYYSPIGQHGEGDIGYLDECEEITKEEYIEVSKNFYTPSDYL